MVVSSRRQSHEILLYAMHAGPRMARMTCMSDALLHVIGLWKWISEGLDSVTDAEVLLAMELYLVGDFLGATK